jgi:peptide-methionine (R)-S-oxide reductase
MSGVNSMANNQEIIIYNATLKTETKVLPIIKSEAQWQEELGDLPFRVLRKEETERAFSGEYDQNKREGLYVCAGCGTHLFSSKNKFDSGTGWPSFDAPVRVSNIGTRSDKSFFSVRTEVHCIRCKGHLGHLFEDGPQKTTGLRYCLNSAALNFIEK